MRFFGAALLATVTLCSGILGCSRGGAGGDDGESPETAPRGLVAAVDSPDSIRLSCNRVSGAFSYVFYGADNEEGPFVELAAFINPEYTHRGLKANVPYFYRVAGANSGGAGPQSGTVSATIAVFTPPLSLTAEAAVDSVTLKWPPVSGVDSYVIYCTDGKDTQEMTAAGSSHTHFGRTPFTKYTYRIAALSNSGSVGPQSDPVTAVTAPIPLSPKREMSMVASTPITAEGYRYYSFPVRSGPVSYEVTWNDSADGDGTQTADINVEAYLKSENVITDLSVRLFAASSGYTTPKIITQNISTPSPPAAAAFVILRISCPASGSAAITYSELPEQP